jgi:hypothetical protein
MGQDLNVATLTCPSCGHQADETLPVDCCLYFYRCVSCEALMRPTPGDCCVFCSYGNHRCPFVQDGTPCPDAQKSLDSIRE